MKQAFVDISCQLCGQNQQETVLTCQGFQLFRCQNCHQISTDKQVKTNYPDQSIYQSKTESARQLKNEAENFRRYSRELLDLLPMTSGELLDVGCGLGWLVAEAQKRGFVACGIDEAKPFIEVGRKALGVPLSHSSLADYKTKKKFDVIVLKHVLEHIEDPQNFLAKTNSLLKNNGLILVACPNIRSLMFWLFHCRWYGLQPAQHVWQFSPATLVGLIKLQGYKIDKVVTTSLDYQPGGFKQIAFFLLTNLANWTGLGDQVIIIARKK